MLVLYADKNQLTVREEEQSNNRPVTAALGKLEKHLNQAAHKEDD